jgi:hypothetical protein
MTKVEAIKEFYTYVLPQVYQAYGKRDKPAIREAWNNFTDSLQREGKITEDQYNNWGNPF